MKRISILTALTIMLVGGVASADHWHRGGGHRHNGGWSGGWSGGVVVRTQPVRVIQPRVVVVQRPRVVQRPVVVVRTEPTYVEPTYVAPPPQPAQIWIEGRWSWTGWNWTWIEGHYEYQQAPYNTEPPCDSDY